MRTWYSSLSHLQEFRMNTIINSSRLGLTFLGLLSLAACSEQSLDNSITSDELVAMSGKSDHVLSSDELCNLVCDVLREPGGGGCFGQDDCHSYCDENSDRLQGQAMVEYIHCADENPLCYQEMDSCIWSGLYPEPSETNIRLEGVGFSAYEDFDVYASIEDEDAIRRSVQGTVIEGRFSLEWDQIFTYANGQSILYYVDNNQDGSCTPGIDQGGLATVSPGNSFLSPSYVAQEEATPASQGAWVCDYF